jgi:hypothetical protein
MSGDVATARVDVFTASKDDLNGFDPVEGPAGAGWAHLDSSDWAGGLDRLVAEISGRDMSEFSDHALVFPDRAAGDWDGPWLVRVPDDVVDALALLSHADITSYADRTDLADDQRSRVLALWDMCQQARRDHSDVYQWSQR